MTKLTKSLLVAGVATVGLLGIGNTSHAASLTNFWQQASHAAHKDSDGGKEHAKEMAKEHGYTSKAFKASNAHHVKSHKDSDGGKEHAKEMAKEHGHRFKASSSHHVKSHKDSDGGKEHYKEVRGEGSHADRNDDGIED